MCVFSCVLICFWLGIELMGGFLSLLQCCLYVAVSKDVLFLPRSFGKMIPNLTCTYFFKMGGPQAPRNFLWDL